MYEKREDETEKKNKEFSNYKVKILWEMKQKCQLGKWYVRFVFNTDLV